MNEVKYCLKYEKYVNGKKTEGIERNFRAYLGDGKDLYNLDQSALEKLYEDIGTILESRLRIFE